MKIHLTYSARKIQFSAKTPKCPCLCSCRRGSISFNDSLSASLLWIFHLSHALNLGTTISSIINFGKENFIFMRNLPMLIKFYSEDKLLYLNIKKWRKIDTSGEFVIPRKEQAYSVFSLQMAQFL